MQSHSKSSRLLFTKHIQVKVIYKIAKYLYKEIKAKFQLFDFKTYYNAEALYSVQLV